jgi:hypothetical protein
MRRRHFLGGLSAASFVTASAAEPPGAALPPLVAGIRLPMSALATEAVALARGAMPGWLFNHCIRTYLFGALAAKADGLAFDEEAIFIAAALHDLGLVDPYQSEDEPFEIDGARAAEKFVRDHGADAREAGIVRDAIAFHTSALSALQPPQIELVGRGAGADVFGGGLERIGRPAVDAVVAALPRLGFKAAFEAALVAYCDRKPRAQLGTWTDAFCREHVHDFAFPSLERRLMASPFAE